MPDDSLLFALAETQLGLFTRRQAGELGFDNHALLRRIKRSRLIAVTQRVLAMPGAAMTDERLVMAATLDAGTAAAASHHTVAALWRVPGFQLSPPHTLVPRESERERVTVLGPVHSSTRVLDHHVVRLRGIPVTTPTRTAFDLSGQISYGRWERAVENLWSRRLTSGPQLFRMIDEMSEHGRPRLKYIRAYLDVRGAAYRPAESALEMRAQKLLVEDGQERLVQQHEAGSDDEWIGRIDLADPARKLLVEIQSDLYHTSHLDRLRDRARVDALEAAGFNVLEVREFDIWYRAQWFVDTIRAERASRVARIA